MQVWSSSFRVVQTAILYERMVYINKDTIAKVSEPSPSKEPSHGWQTLGCIEVFLVLCGSLVALRENAGCLVGSLTPLGSTAIAGVLRSGDCFVSGVSKQRIAIESNLS